MNFFLLGYVYQGGDVLLDPSLPVQDVDIQIHSPFAAYARALDVWGRSGKIEIVLPYAFLSGTGTFQDQTRDRKVSGFGDPGVRFSVNLYGAPALSFQEFQEYRQDTIIGVSLLVTAPLGQYDSSKLANIGTNRWSFKPEIGISKALGQWTLEVAAGASFYTNNDSFLGSHTRKQDPVYSMQGHVIYNFRSGIWAGLDATYYTGGRTAIDGVKGDDLQKSWRMGATAAFPVNIRNSIKLYTSTGIQTRTGGDFDVLGIAWQYRWGGGL
ncbi:MAG: transporter [Syntrophorhabdaceae bacterium]